MTGCAQTGSVDTVVVFDDQTIHGILELLRIIGLDRLSQQLIIAVAVHIGVRYNGKAGILQHLQLCQFGLLLQMIADQIEGKELQKAFPRLICIQLSRAAGRQISGMRIGFLQTGIDEAKMGP